MPMIQKRTVSDDIDPVSGATGRPVALIGKVTIKEKKAAKRKEKSRVAAQIRRNKESQTLILLQNALPLALPSPSQMLEKSIVIRIAGQTLFLMNTLDQVLGMDGWLTIPLISNNFLTFFMDSAGQIVYASPNIQLLLDQYHWSNLIGMSMYDVIDFKSRWPSVGEVVRMKLTTNPNITSDPASFVCSTSTNLQSPCSRTTIASRLNMKKNSQTWNDSSSTCSLYNVWCCTNISHTNLKLKLLILQAVQIKSSVLNNVTLQHEPTKNVILSNSSTMTLDRGLSWPSISSPMKIEAICSTNSTLNQLDSCDSDMNNPKCIYKHMVTSAHDKFYNFKSASTEFYHLIGEVPNSLISLNFLDIIHLEDVIKVKSFLDLIIESHESHIWTPIYRISCQDGRQCVVRTLAKQYSTNSSHSLILNHLIIENSLTDDQFTVQNMNEHRRIYSTKEKIISLLPVSNKITKKSSKETYVIRADNDNSIVIKRRSNEVQKNVSDEKYPRLISRAMSNPVPYSNSFLDPDQSIKLSPKIQSSTKLQSIKKFKLETEMLNSDPFLPMDLDHSFIFRKSRKDDLSSFGNSHLRLDENEPITKSSQNAILYGKLPGNGARNRSPSYSMESCVVTSPGSESTDVPIDDHFVWGVGSSFQDELSQLNCWLDDQDQDQNDLELILPI